MKFLETINQKKYTLISIFLFFYVIFNLFDGERGLSSYYEKRKIMHDLVKEKELLTLKLNEIEKKNQLLTDAIDLDYLETLYREKFMFGKENEKIYSTN
ncbi:septation ring formation regulator EzrA [Pelagibacteraceae bacterium]|nr:septation ring formation regulator EzrA [Pelagibacteraceae bacterium]